ncbi:MAG: hypothetical protein AAF754_19855 [Pseudomonadota bacterium]
MTTPLERALLDAHSHDDKEALVTLYARAADEAVSDAEKRFFLTHAYIFALDCGHSDAHALKTELIRLGAEPR